MSKRRLDESGFWKPNHSNQTKSHSSTSSSTTFSSSSSNNNNNNNNNHIFNFNSSPLYIQKTSLPIYKHKKQILYALEHYSVIVIVGETGSGKSTQLPQYFYENGWCGNGGNGGNNDDGNECYKKIVCTQPRRIAAQTLCNRVAKEIQCPIGTIVGYKVRFDNQTNKHYHHQHQHHHHHQHQQPTCIEYVTDGILIRDATLYDPLLSKYSIIMIDEAHERNINTDVLLGIVKKIRRKRGGHDFKVVICSATIDAQKFLDFFISPNDIDMSSNDDNNDNNNNNNNNSNNNQQRKRKRRWGKVGEDGTTATTTMTTKSNKRNNNIINKGTIISIDGRQHPVDILHIQEPVADYIKATVDTALRIHYDLKNDNGGDILAFLPTGEDIDRAIHYANESLSSSTSSWSRKSSTSTNQKDIAFYPLYGTLPYHMQAKVFQPKLASDHTRRVIFATNIAETSVTVPHISSVIDCGYVKMPFYDTETGFDRLVISPISIASAKQRAGRAGRVQPGKCYRLYTEAEMNKTMRPNTIPEILRTNLASFLLTLKALGIKNILAFDLMTLPSVPALCQGLESLYILGAIDDQTNLTELGKVMAEFPTEPQVSKMMIESFQYQCSKEILCIAAAQQVRSLFYQPRTPKQNMDYDAALRDLVDSKSDHVTYVRLMQMNDAMSLNEEDCKEYFVNYQALKRANEVRKQLTNCLKRYGKIESITDSSFSRSDDEVSACIRRCITSGYFSNTAKLGNDGRYYSLRGSHMISVSTSSVFQRFGLSSEYILFGETYDGTRGGIEVSMVSAIEGSWLREIAPHYWD